MTPSHPPALDPRHPRSLENLVQNLIYSSSRAIIRTYARLMLKLDILWQSPLPTGPKLIVANHPSMTDPFLLPLLSPEPIKLLITVKAFHVPVFGAYLYKSGHIPVVPGNGRTAFKAVHRLLKAGHSVALFPEGWVSPQQEGFNPPRTGTARLAMLTGVPIVPVGIYLQRERNHVITTTIKGAHSVGYWYLRGPYSMTVGHPLHFKGDVQDQDRVKFVSDSIMQRIISLAHQSEHRTTGNSPPPYPGVSVRKLAHVPVRTRDEK